MDIDKIFSDKYGKDLMALHKLIVELGFGLAGPPPQVVLDDVDHPVDEPPGGQDGQGLADPDPEVAELRLGVEGHEGGGDVEPAGQQEHLHGPGQTQQEHAEHAETFGSLEPVGLLL